MSDNIIRKKDEFSRNTLKFIKTNVNIKMLYISISLKIELNKILNQTSILFVHEKPIRAICCRAPVFPYTV